MIVKTNLKGKIALFASIGVVAIVFIWFLYNVYNENYEKNREETLKNLIEPPEVTIRAETIEAVDYEYKKLKENAESYLKKVERYDENPFKENAVKWRVYLTNLKQTYEYTLEKELISSLKAPPSNGSIWASTVADLIEKHRVKINEANGEIKKVKGFIKQYGDKSELNKNLEQWTGYHNILFNTVYDCPQHDLTCYSCGTINGRITCPRCKGNYSGFEGIWDNCDSCDDYNERYNGIPGTNKCRNHRLKEVCPYCNTRNGKLRITH